MKAFAFWSLLTASVWAVDLSTEEAEARLRMALQIAREHNDRALVAKVEKAGRDFKAGLPEDADKRLREVEAAVGIDPGGWSMAGQPLFHPTAAMKAKQPELHAKLTAAMQSDDAAQVRAATQEMLTVLGDQAACRMDAGLAAKQNRALSVKPRQRGYFWRL